jgi:hypothetical protein
VRLDRKTKAVLLAAALTSAAAAASVLTSAQSATAQVSAYPLSGTISASPTTQISLRGVKPDAIGTVAVSGSRSGRHSGRLRPHSDGVGASWLPDRRFQAGETVTVRTGLHIRGARDGDFRFRVARIPGRVTIPKVVLENIDAGKTRRFRSRRDLAPPVVTVDPGPRQTAPGYVFLSPKSKKDQKQAGPMIVDDAGRPVYFRPLPGIQAATDFRTQVYKGRPVLTYWQGTSRQGIGTGELVMLDQSYRVIRRIRTPNGFRPDLHEFLLTPAGRAVFITYPVVRTDLRRVGGSRNGLAVDSVIQEVDLDTGLVTFEWHSLGKIALRETHSRPAANARIPFDYVHANSVAVDASGDFLLSARNTWAVYKIDRETGGIVWRLGGRRSDFELGRGAHFAWQHDARWNADGTLSVFDNSAFPPVRKHSRAVTLHIDEAGRRATLVNARLHPRGLLAATQGNVQRLPGGGEMVNWGSQRYFTEFGLAGRVLWNARLALGYESYRAYRLPWVGLPHTRPRAAVRRSVGGMDVYASWNGATEVATWEVLGGAAADRLAPIGAHGRTGFETRVPLSVRTAYVAVRAKDSSARVLATSPARRVTG